MTEKLPMNWLYLLRNNFISLLLHSILPNIDSDFVDLWDKYILKYMRDNMIPLNPKK
jgi:hypothetical protein